MNREEMLFTLVAEECGELAQRATKILRFGVDNSHPDHPDKNNTLRFFEELFDIMAVTDMLIDEGYLTVPDGIVQDDEILKKQKKIKKYLKLSKELGKLQ